MLRTFLAGALAAYVGSRLLKMNEEGKLEPYKERLRDEAGKLRARLDETLGERHGTLSPSRPAPPPAPAGAARPSPDPFAVSKPAQAHPWPVDPRALPGEG